MKKAIFIITALVFTVTISAQNVWTVDKAHAKLGFSVTHMLVSDVEGSFKNFDVKVNSSNDDFKNAQIELSAEITSINTDNEARDKHLKTADFFDAEKFPILTFKSTEFKQIEGKKYKLTGNLTMHGVTRWITLDVKFNGTTIHPYSKKTVAGFKISGTLKRSDFGIGASTPAGVVSDEIEILTNIEIIKE